MDPTTHPDPLPESEPALDSTARTSSRSAPRVAPRYVLQVAVGSDAGRRLELTPERTSATIGRHPTCDLPLSDEQISARHVSLWLEGCRLHLVDLGSRNGCLINGVAVRDGFLADGDVLRMGRTLLDVQASGGSPESADEGASTQDRFGKLLGASVELRRLHPLLSRLAASEVPVVIEGETGTGKEVLAESLHAEGRRATGPFVVFDCTATPANLIESALFGHERGAFTGAVSASVGVFEQANRGTLLIDEIGDLDLSLQGKLLRAVERSEIRRVGGNRWIRVDVRVLCATRRDLTTLIEQGTFRDDLFFRLAVARVRLPPLRKRRTDIPLLARTFWQTLGGEGNPPESLLARFDAHVWPGNVRELRNAVARAVAVGDLAEASFALHDEPHPTPEDKLFLTVVDETLQADLPLREARERVVAEFERRYLARAMEASQGHVRRAAERAGIAERYFRLLRARYDSSDK
jgi:two-component system response regulator HydG